MARRRTGKKIDFVHWTTSFASVLGQGSGAAARTLLAAQHLPETLMRMRGESVVYLDGAQAPPQLVIVEVGIILVPEGTGTTVLWSPTADGDAPWIWWDTYFIGHEEYVTDALQSVMINGARRVVDSKAMRIVRNQEVQYVVENTAIIGVENINAMCSVRVLAGK